MNFSSFINCSLNDFFHSHWEKNLYFTKSKLNLARLKKPLLEWDTSLLKKIIHTGDLIFVKNSEFVNEGFLKNKNMDEVKILNFLYEEGYTFYLRNVENHFSEVSKLVNEFESELYPLKVQCNLFITPPKKVGLNAHFDCHDVIVYQLRGQKSWNFWPAMKQNMTTDSPNEQDQKDVYKYINKLKPSYSYTMSANDLVYMPRGAVHQPVQIGDIPSHHLTFWLKAPLIDFVPDKDEIVFKERSQNNEYVYI